MLEIIRDLNKTLTEKDRTEGKWLFVLILFSAFLETIGVVSVLPFLAVLARPELIQTNQVLHIIYSTLGFTSIAKFNYFLGFLALISIILANSISAYMNWKLSEFTHMRAHTLSVRILNIFLYLPYVHFLQRDTMDMAKNILTEVAHVTKNLFIALLQAFSKFIVCLFIITVLILNNPILAISVGGVLALSYAGIYFFVRRKLQDIGEIRLKTTSERFTLLSEILKGVKEIRLNGAEKKYIHSYENLSYATSRSYAQYDVISMMPRYILETIAFTIILAVVLYLMHDQASFLDALPEIGFYAIAGQRLLPSLQNIFLNVTKIKYGLPSLKEIIRDLELIKETLPYEQKSVLTFKNLLSLRNINFSYHEDGAPILKLVDLDIISGQKVAFVGPTGSGKSTIIDIITGMLFPTSGEMTVDRVLVDKINVSAWQKNISYVPQSIFLFNSSFVKNIAIAQDDTIPIDMEKIIKAAKMAQLHDFIIQETDKGYETIIGENGIRLSGGQKQRLGLARAIYSDKPVMVLDEATSALDNVTEQAVINAIAENGGNKTIIMVAHRLSTVAKCDVIYYLEKGHIKYQGTYQELLDNSQEFRTLDQVGKQEFNTEQI